MLHSLKSRLLVSALLMILIVLPIIGFTLSNAFEQQLKVAINNELSAYSYSILAVAEVDNSQLFLPEHLHENQFNVIQSGLYALFSEYEQPSLAHDNGDVLWRSNSLTGLTLTENLPSPVIGATQNSELLIEGELHLVYSFSVAFAELLQDQAELNQAIASEYPVTLHIIKNMNDYQQMITTFNQSLWSWLAVLMVVLIIVQFVWLAWTTKPLSQLQEEILHVQQGKSDQLKLAYPYELQTVAKQLNAFIQAEQSQQKRYRNALSDLAHSLKTPLAVMQSSENLSNNALQQVAQINATIEHQLKRAQSAGENIQSRHINIANVVNRLEQSFKKIYSDNALQVNIDIDTNLQVRCDESDFMEIIGNVLDNAYKAAKSTIIVQAKVRNGCVQIQVHDDGKGVANTEYKAIFNRGVRLDSYDIGTGVGLAVARDITESYQGELTVAQSSIIGGAVFTILL